MAGDLYSEWLGISADGRQVGFPPDHYTLLGLPRFCHHEVALEEAARRRLETLDRYAIHPEKIRRDMCSRMMNEIANARVILSDPKRRNAYDRDLAEQLGVAVPTKPVAPPPDMIPLSEGGVGLNQVGDLAPRDQGDVAFLDSSLEPDAPEIRVEADLTAPRAHHSSLPPMPMMIAGGVVMVIVIGVIFALVFTGGDSNNVTTTSHRLELPPPPPPPEPARPDVRDTFTSERLGAQWSVRRSPGSEAVIQNGRLAFQIVGLGDDEGQANAEFTPRASNQAFEEAAVTLMIKPRTSFSLAIGTSGPRFSVRYDGTSLTVQARPGNPAGEYASSWTWAVIDHPADQPVLIEMTRNRGTVAWKVNGKLVAESPDMTPVGHPSLVLVAAGDDGAGATVSDVSIWYKRR